MTHPLMPKATAVWLVENTALTFEQIADFCGMHALEVQAIADDEVAIGMQGLDPISAGELTQEEIDRCSTDSGLRLNPAATRTPIPKKKGARYTPVSKRQDRPDAIAWLLKNYPELSDAQISKLIGTTKPTISSIRDRSHWNAANIKPQNPVGLGLCSGDDLEKVVAIARARAGTVRAAKDNSSETPASDAVHIPITEPETQTEQLPAPEAEPLAIEQQDISTPINMPAPEAPADPIAMPGPDDNEGNQA